MIGQIAAVAWIALSWLFLAAVVWTVRKARARGKRLFRDLPNQRLGPPPDRPVQIDHRWDAL